MASVNAFTDMVKEFLTEMTKVFPEEEQIKTELDKVKEFTSEQSKEFLDKFSTSMKVNGKYIEARNPKIFKKGRAEFFDDIKLYKLWKETTRKNTRDAIWNYISTLHILSTTINAIPQDVMSNIEKMAEDCASKLVKDCPDGEVDLSKIDMGALMKGVQDIMGSLGNSPGMSNVPGKMSGMPQFPGFPGFPGMSDIPDTNCDSDIEKILNEPPTPKIGKSKGKKKKMSK